jgi:hypothetical protein
VFTTSVLAQPKPRVKHSEIHTGIDAQADQLLKRMSDYLKTRKQYSATVDIGLESLLTSGQKLLTHGQGHVAARNPDRFRSAVRGGNWNLEFYYDGSRITVHDKSTDHFADTDAPPTMDEAIEFAESRLGLDVPGSDLFISNTYEALMEDVFAAVYVGSSLLRGVECHHLAFRAEETDWEIWIAKGDKPLPVKYIVRTKWTTGSPAFFTEFTDWDVSTSLPDSEFAFAPPAGAKRIVFGPPQNRGESQN